jgi:hypothetical protein
MTALWNFTVSNTAFNKSSIPSPVFAEIGTNLTFNALDNPDTSITSPLFLDSSIILRATTMGTSISISCMLKYRFLSILVASTIFITTSGLSNSMYSLVTTSSGEYGDNEYIPGKSTRVTSYPYFPAALTRPSFFSTVTPGLLPT